MAIEYPKRTLAKNKNRQRLIDAAERLFATKGYQHTTLDDVAVKAGLHVQTLYRHFKNKNELAIAAANTAVDHLREHFERAHRSQSTFQIWREFIKDSVSGLTPMGIGEHKRHQLRSDSSMMNDNFLLIVYSGYEDLLTKHLALDFHMDPKHDRLPRLAACMLWSGNEAAMKRCAGLDIEQDLLDDEAAILAESLAVVADIEKVFTSYFKQPRVVREAS